MPIAIEPIDNATPVRVLQHPSETRHHLNTAQWVRTGLRHAQVIAARQFTPDDWTVAGYEPVLLFPGEPVSSTGQAQTQTRAHPGADKPTATRRSLVVIDGTWRQANAILRAHPALLALPRLALSARNQSMYRLRKSPRADGVCTIEAVAMALDLLDAPQCHDELLKPFRDRIDAQIRLQREIMGETAFAKNYPHLRDD